MIKTPLSTVIGGAFWTPGCTVIGGNTPTFDQQILKLFANGEQGFYYDPNDLSTMWQDAAGTVPVTGVGQAVGLMLDKSKGLAASQNLLPQKSFAEGTTGWTLQSGWVKAGDKVSNQTGSTALESPLQLVVGKLYRITLNTSRTREGGTLSIRSGVTLDTQMVAASVDGIQSFLLRPMVATHTLRFQSIGWYGDIHSVEVVEVYGNHAYQTTSASRPILRQNATTGANYLEFDGTNDFLQTNNIDFSSTDEMGIFAGICNPSQARPGSFQVVVELGADTASNNGAFVLSAPHGTFGNIQYSSRGTTRSNNVFRDITAEHRVITAKSDISSNLNSIRVNGGAYLDAEGTQGTGNYGNLPLYIGSRAGTTLPFTGHIYGLMGIGKLVSDNETTAIEKELAKRTGVTLNV